MQWAKIFGSKKVVVFDISEERLELAKRLGADEVINTTKENFMEEAMAITDGKGYAYCNVFFPRFWFQYKSHPGQLPLLS